MKAWLIEQWRAFQDSYDPDEVAAGSQPQSIALALLAMLLIIGTIAYVPALAADFHQPEVAMGLAIVGAVISYISWVRRCRGLIGGLATLFDNAFYSAALIYASLNTKGGYSTGLAVLHGMMVLAFPAQSYGLTPIFATAMVIPVVAGLALYRPGSDVLVILIGTYLMLLVLALYSRRKRELLRRQSELTRAVGAATRVADDSVQAALATTLLSLGHFLHELRNCQTAIRSNLSFIEMTAELSEDAREALADALAAQNTEEQLVMETIDALRERAAPADNSFLLSEVIQAAAESSGAVVNERADGDFIVAGKADHLAGVLNNLTRNAEQAGANQVHIDTQLAPSGQAVELVIHDDGPGIPVDKRDILFKPFVTSGNPTGTGLGLYLCRRYVELFGGTIKVTDGPLGGAAFVIRLPGTRPNSVTKQALKSSAEKRDAAAQVPDSTAEAIEQSAEA